MSDIGPMVLWFYITISFSFRNITYNFLFIQVYDRLQPLGVTLSHSVMLRSMEGISGHFNSELVDSIRAGQTYRIVGDNINFQVGVKHGRRGKDNKHMVYWFGSAAIIQNLKFDDLLTVCPQQDLRHATK